MKLAEMYMLVVYERLTAMSMKPMIVVTRLENLMKKVSNHKTIAHYSFT